MLLRNSGRHECKKRKGDRISEAMAEVTLKLSVRLEMS